jgi:hypothetical protein
MITFEWTISALDCAVSKDELTNVVETIHWRYRGTNENNTTAETYGAQSVGDPNPEEFTPFEDLTLEIVTQWLESIMDMEKLQQNIENQINEIENPTHVTLHLPTNPEPNPTEPEIETTESTENSGSL